MAKVKTQKKKQKTQKTTSSQNKSSAKSPLSNEKKTSSRLTSSSSLLAKKRDRCVTEERLIRAGTEVFSTFGFDAATTKMISQKSNVNESLIMRYFGGKEGLLLEIIKRFFDEHHTTPLPYPPQESLEAELIKYTHHVVSKSHENRAIFRIMLLRASVDAKLRKSVQSFIAPDGDPALEERLKDLRTKGKIPAHVPNLILHMVTFEKLSAIFISEIMFEAEKQKVIHQALEELVSHEVRSLLKNGSKISC